uniref:DUF5899 domain-containing protein n=1 Tax=viral metagenome TaxID=1070528 RepID=A0A6C0KQP4_9ZZZZ
MEIAIPLVALGGMYVISNQNKNKSYTEVKKKENFNNMGIRTNLGTRNTESPLSNYLPNTNIPPQNYPIMNNKELVDNIQEYPNPNVATDKYFNQNVYENKERAGVPIENQIQKVYSLTGDYLSSKEFMHNNMVPFVGSKPRGQVYNNNNAETILDNYVGNGSQIIKKIEQAPLFKPQDNVQWPYGMPDMSDFYQSRQNPVNRNNMVKPFESVRVGPGLDKGYTADGSHGFNAGMEARDKWLPKTVDELRITTNPKQEYTLDSLQGPAQSMIKNVGIEGRVEKYRPDTFFINTQDRWLTTTGAEKATRMVSEEIIKTSHRNETTTFQHGTPNAILKTASYVPKKYEEPKRNQLDGFDVGPSKTKGSGPHNDFDKNLNSHTNYANNRAINNQPQTFGTGFSRAIGAAIAPVIDILKPSRKEEYSCNMRIYGNLSGEVPGNYVLSPGDVPTTTIKEMTLYRPNGNIGNQSDNAGYLVNDQQPIANQRDTMNQDKLLGMATKYGNRQVDAEYRQTNNESKEKSLYNRTNQGNAKQFNSQINVTLSKVDSDRENNRLWAPSIVVPSGPSVQTYGKANMPQYYDNCLGCDRIAPDILNAFKENPYTHSLTNSV